MYVYKNLIYAVSFMQWCPACVILNEYDTFINAFLLITVTNVLRFFTHAV